MKNLDFYFDVIDGKESVDSSMFQDENEEDKRGLILQYAFDSIIEMGDKTCSKKLVSYIDENINLYSIRKKLALMNLGYVASNDAESLLISYLSSEHPDLQFAAFCSICEMGRRDALSDETLSFLTGYISKGLKNQTFSHEEVIEIVMMLYDLDIIDGRLLIDMASASYPEAVSDAKGFVN